jgi:hypothetical protein
MIQNYVAHAATCAYDIGQVQPRGWRCSDPERELQYEHSLGSFSASSYRVPHNVRNALALRMPADHTELVISIFGDIVDAGVAWRKAMIDREHDLPISRLCIVLTATT